MDPWARERIEDWRVERFNGGRGGIHELADAGFSGALVAGDDLALLVNGKVVHLEGFALEAVPPRATPRVAPDPALPLLFAMREQPDTQEGRYYTEDTPLVEAHDRLVEGGFTGYLELAEHVLSGDYYVCYYGGQAFPVAFVGEAERLLTGEDALERAMDEVGLYDVRAVDLGVETLPPLPDGARTPPANGEATDPDEAAPGVHGAEGEHAEAPPADAPAQGASAVAAEEENADGASVDGDAPSSEVEASSDVDPAEASAGEPTAAPEAIDEAVEGDDAGPHVASDPDATPEAADLDLSEAGAGEPTTAGDPTDDDPEPAPDATPPDGVEPDDRLGVDAETAPTASEPSGTEASAPEADPSSERAPSTDASAEDATDSGVRIEPEDDPRHPSQRDEAIELTPEAALGGTHLFVRYRDRRGATLETVTAGRADRDDLVENLTLEPHTTFPEGRAVVDGVGYPRFAERSLAVATARWLVADLPFELIASRSTKLAGLIDVLPEIDRIDFVEAVDAGSDHRFDLVARDRGGDARVVADLHPSREATTADHLNDLAEATTAAVEGGAPIAGAFLVTGSFFEPAVLELAADLAGGGLLRRGREGTVRVGRRRSFHLGLVEYRSETAHVVSPDL
ncbi:MAG: hypothetical protein ACLFMX_08205 [Halobacteriales archaeon]